MMRRRRSANTLSVLRKYKIAAPTMVAAEDQGRKGREVAHVAVDINEHQHDAEFDFANEREDSIRDFGAAAVADVKECKAIDENDAVLVPQDLAEQLKQVTRFHNGYHLTDEQDRAVDLALTGTDLKVEAFAGAGKTSTLDAVGTHLGLRGLYIAFNSSIAKEAAMSFPDNVECKTAHSLAYKAVGYKYRDRLKKRLSGGMLAEEFLHVREGSHPVFTPAGIGNLVLATVAKFCHSADQEVNKNHVPWQDLKVLDDDKILKKNTALDLVVFAQKTWEMLSDLDGTIPVTHDVYLKVWALSEPEIFKDFILFDEAQDANPLMLDLITRQNAQKIFVGDRYQQIYSWRGAVNAMQEIEMKHTSLTQSFRFGQSIADVANAILNRFLGANVAIRGFEKIDSSVGALALPNAYLCRTNATLISTLINRVERGDVVYIEGGCRDLLGLLRGAEKLIAGQRSEHQQLSAFKNWSELVEFSESSAGAELATLVKLVEKYELSRLIGGLKKSERVKKDQADIVLSTVHKAKGQEWGGVKLANDFRHPDSKGYSDEETNLLYVAATRAVNCLDITDCEAAQKAMGWV